jgi:hypothetical protein
MYTYILKSYLSFIHSPPSGEATFEQDGRTFEEYGPTPFRSKAGNPVRHDTERIETMGNLDLESLHNFR